MLAHTYTHTHPHAHMLSGQQKYKITRRNWISIDDENSSSHFYVGQDVRAWLPPDSKWTSKTDNETFLITLLLIILILSLIYQLLIIFLLILPLLVLLIVVLLVILLLPQVILILMILLLKLLILVLIVTNKNISAFTDALNILFCYLIQYLIEGSEWTYI